MNAAPTAEELVASAQQHQQRGDMVEAARLYREVLRLLPAWSEAHNALGTVLEAQGKIDEAEAAYRKSIALKPEFSKAHYNLGNLRRERGFLDEALACYDRALALRPDFLEARWNRSTTALASGAFAAGWDGFEGRWQRKATERAAKRPFPQPEWDGRDLGDGRLLVWGEQGLGDEIIYGSMIPDLVARGMRLVVEADGRLVPLFQRSWPQAQVVPRSDPPNPATSATDVRAQSAVGSLGRWVRRDAASFPAKAGYLAVDKARAENYRATLGGQGLVVGLSWISQNPKVGTQKSTSLLDWAPVLKTPGTRFVDLQYGDTAAERADVRSRLGVEVQHLAGLDLREDLDGLAALMAACDLVITVSNTTAHLTGALGVPVWVLVPAAVGQFWYWGVGRTDSPWYPSARLFRQQQRGAWAPVLRDVAAQLGRLPKL